MAADPSVSPRSRIARFGVYELEFASGELRRGGVRIPIQDQPARILEYLLEHAGEVITRDELRQRLWPAEFVEFDHSLNTAIRKLRASLDDSADNPRFIETLARRGYRFIAPVSWDGEEAAPTPALMAAPRRVPRAAIITVAAVGIAVFAAAILYFRRTAPAAKSVDSVAVLPFINADRDTQHINDGLTEMLIDTVSRLPGLRVMAPTTVFRYKDRAIDPKRAGQELGVGAVVTGRIRVESGNYIVRVELIDTSDGAQLWSNRYDAATSELPSVGNRIADDLATELRHGDHSTEGRPRYAPTAEAYELYTRGLFAWKKRQSTKDLQDALQYFTAATKQDPKFAAAYAGLSNTYGVMAGYGLISAAEGTAHVIANGQKALDLDPSNAEALTSIATTKFRNVWDFPGAEADYRRALAINPNYATGHEWYSDFLRDMGRPVEARREIDLARSLDPLSTPIMTMKCYNLYYERRYREAIAFVHRMRAVEPTFSAPVCTVNSFLAAGDYDGLVAEARTFGIGNVAGHTGQIADPITADSREAFLRNWLDLLLGDEHRNERQVAIAMVYAQLGDRDRAFSWLEQAYQGRTSHVTDIGVEPLLDPLHDDPRWVNLLRRIGLPNVQPANS